MPLIYVEAPTNITECIQCPNCSRTYAVPEDDDPRSTCGRCGCSMDTDKVGDFAEVNAAASNVALGMGVVALNAKAIRGLVGAGFTEEEATDIIAAKAKADAAETEKPKKATKG